MVQLIGFTVFEATTVEFWQADEMVGRLGPDGWIFFVLVLLKRAPAQPEIPNQV